MRDPQLRRALRPTAAEDLDRELDVLARLMDAVFRVPGLGWRFGLDPILGLVPMVGDLITTAVSVYILLAGLRYGVPKITLVRMAMNVAIDMIVGSVPLVGDLFDAYWKSNVRNLALLRQRVSVSGRRGADFSDWLFVGLIVVLLVALVLGGVALLVWAVGAVIGSLRR